MILTLPKRARAIYHEYPSQFWIVVGASFIDRVGGALIFPFFSLYITQRFGVGMTEVGVLFALFAAATMVGTTLGGALTDHIGRKNVILMGLIISGMTSLGMGLVTELWMFYVMGVISGLFAEAAGPAQQAMLTDLLPEKQRTDGFGIMRVAMNLAVAIGPALGGLLASRSYLGLFATDTITSLITAFILHRAVAETRPQNEEGETATENGLGHTFRGYTIVLRDRAFMAFMLLSIVVTIVYVQMYSTLAVYLRDIHGVPARGFGFIMSLNAAMVVGLQFPITRRIRSRAPLVVMAVGTLFYALGFGMYAFVGTFTLFLLAIAVVTVGEMLIIPTSQAVVAGFAPEDMRGRYMAVMGFSWMLPSMIGPLGAGLIIDHADPRWVWYLSGLLGMAAAFGFATLHQRWRKVSQQDVARANQLRSGDLTDP